VVAAHWNGLYAGANAGGTWGKSQTESPLTSAGCATAVCYVQSVIDDINNQSARTLWPSGFTGGVQAGYNVQSGHLVFGGEADFGALRLRQTNTQTAFFNCCPPPGSANTYTNSISTSWLLTARGRLGLAANNWLLYATGGVALTRVAYGHTYVEGTAGGATGLETATASATRTGYVVGGGLEVAGDQGWSLKAEYLYLDFGSISTGPVPLGSSAQTVFGHVFNHSATLTANVVRVGLNYKFR
jgi:outer membrane immunogenic protein